MLVNYQFINSTYIYIVLTGRNDLKGREERETKIPTFPKNHSNISKSDLPVIE